MPTVKDGLLDMLLKRTHGYYLSDLRKPELYAQLAETLTQIGENEYTLREWNDAAAYIFPESAVFETEEAAKKYLLQMFQ